MRAPESFYSPADWLVFAAYLVVVLGVVAILRKRTNPRTGGVPWPVVGFSLAAAEVSGLGLVAIPGLLLSIHGNLAYLQWILGAVVARFFLTFWMRRVAGGSTEEPSPSRRGSWILIPAEILVLSARTMVAALPLHWMTPLPFAWCLLFVFALVGLCLVAGKHTKTVVWCEAGQLLVIFALLALVLVRIVGKLQGGWDGWIASSASAEDYAGTVSDKWVCFDFRTDPSLEFTFWTALLAYPFLQCQLFLADRGMRSRLETCSNKNAAIKALWWSLAGQIFTVILALIGMALYVHYRQFPITDPSLLRAVAWGAGEPGRPDTVFWLWVLTETGTGLKGALLGAFLMAGVSGLHGQLLGWNDVDVKTTAGEGPDKTTSSAPLARRFLLLALASIAALGVERFYLAGGEGLLEFVYGLLAYVTGPLLAFALVKESDPSRFRKGGLIVGILLTWALTASVRRDHSLVSERFLHHAESPEIGDEYDRNKGIRSSAKLASPWLWPAGTILSGLFAWGFRRKTG